jgi:hypothetical protein
VQVGVQRVRAGRVRRPGLCSDTSDQGTLPPPRQAIECQFIYLYLINFYQFISVHFELRDPARGPERVVLDTQTIVSPCSCNFTRVRTAAHVRYAGACVGGRPV